MKLGNVSLVTSQFTGGGVAEAVVLESRACFAMVFIEEKSLHNEQIQSLKLASLQTWFLQFKVPAT